ncbi:MAG: Fic family protein [Nanoarchaeota archaeon]|nr:Fic family protein [Nanoarchaeota archaeon]MBU4124086.1 Fic family protein [Nanoarchaeota archaeon]
MVTVEKIKRGNKTYFYVSKNFRMGNNKWKRIRKYFGNKEPTKEQIRKTAEQIELEAKKLGLAKESHEFKYITDDEVEVLEDIKQSYNDWWKRLPDESKQKYSEDFLVRFTYNSNAIEGNTLSLRDTHLILQENIIPSDATTYEYNEVVNSRKCMNFIKKYRGDLNKTFILKVHGLLTVNTAVRIVGKYRDHDVIIGGSEHRPPSYKEVPELMRQFFVWYNNNKDRMHPLELACLVHTKFARIHPFSDGNGRTSRVLTNFVLHKHDYPMFIVENKDRSSYYNTLEKSDKGDDRSFVKFIFDNIVGQLRRKTGK